MPLPAWEETQRRLHALGASATASECHGVLCGLLAAGHSQAREAWLAESVGAEAPGGEIERIFDETVAQVDDDAFRFELLLPGDEQADLGGRTQALADWAAGFTFGMACAGRHPDDLPDEVAEFLRDAAEIARLSHSGADEGGEADFAEVVEYLRAGTLLTRTECRAQA